MARGRGVHFIHRNSLVRTQPNQKLRSVLQVVLLFWGNKILRNYGGLAGGMTTYITVFRNGCLEGQGDVRITLERIVVTLVMMVGRGC
jgi:hypothetical protein